MATNEFELAGAYVSVMPSFANLSDKLSKEFRKAIPAINDLGDKLGSSFTSGIGAKLSAEIAKAAGGAAPLTKALEHAVQGLGHDIEEEVTSAIPATQSLGDALKKSVAGTQKVLQGVFKASSVITAPFNKALMASVQGIGKGLSDTLSVASKGAMTGLAASVGAVGGQVVGGGLNRALSLNSASAKLQALGYQGKEFDAIMKNALEAVNGTAYGLQDSVGAAGGLLAAGVKPGDELLGVLKNTVKLSDMSGRSLKEMGSMMGKNAAAGIVQMDDLNQLIDSNIPIMSELSKTMGKSVPEIKKMASAGKITFDDLNKTISNMTFDSVLLGTKDVGVAFGNLRSALSRQGATLWQPIIDGLLPIIITSRKIVDEFGKQFNFTPITTKIADHMKKIGEVFQKFNDDQGNIDGSKIKNLLDDIEGRYKKFKDTIKGFEGPIIGIIAGMSGSILAGIPIIGPLFAGITPVVGLFAGTLFQAFRSSEKLQDTIKGLGKWITDLSTNFATLFTGEGGKNPMGAFGDKLAAGIEKVKKIITDVIGKLVERGPEIRDAIKSVWDSIKNALGNGDGFNGAAIGNIIVETIKTFAGYLQTVIPIMVNLAKSVSAIITSDGMTGFFKWIAGVAAYVAANQDVLLKLGVFLGALFVAKKLSGPILATVSFLGKLKVPATAMKIGPVLGKMIAGLIDGIKPAMTAVLKALPYILGGIAAFAIIMAAIAGVGWLANLPGVMDALRGFGSLLHEIGSWISDGVSQFIKTVMPLLEFLKGYLLGAMAVIGDILVKLTAAIGDGAAKITTAYYEGKAKVVTATADGLANVASAVLVGQAVVLKAAAGLADSILGGMTNLVNSVSNFFLVLASQGEAAGKGAYAAAGGILALMQAIGGGSLQAGIGSAAGAIFAGMTGQGSPLESMLQAVERLAAVNSVVLSMPIAWSAVLGSALAFGLAIPDAIANGINQNSTLMKNSLGVQLESMLNDAQARLDAKPLIIRTKLDQESFNATSVGSGSVSNSNTYNNQRNTTVMAQGFNSLDAILRAAR